jgi:uncharacterized protein
MNQHLDDRLDVLDRRSCLELLATATVGRIGWAAQDGRVEIRLVNIALDGEDVVIRCEPGTMLDALHTGRAVAVEADALEPALRTGWTVVVTGRAAEVDAGPQAERLVDLVQPWAGGERRHLIRVRAEQVTGRRLRLTAGGSTVVSLEPPVDG